MSKATQPVDGSAQAAGLWGPQSHPTTGLCCVSGVVPTQGSCHAHLGGHLCHCWELVHLLLGAAHPQPKSLRLSPIFLSVAFPPF